MKNNFAALVLIGAVSYTPHDDGSVKASKVNLQAYQKVDNNIQGHTLDWDDLLRDTDVFNAGSYEDDSPDGYTAAVNEVVEDRDKELLKKKAAREAYVAK